jgi:tRNA G18 (ribose-2'-O)-methylase SpoU
MATPRTVADGEASAAAAGIISGEGAEQVMNHVLSKPELRRAKLDRAAFAALARNPVTVVLDRVTGFYNIGAIFRLCDAFLVERLVICGAEPLMLRKRKLVQAATGSQRWVPWDEAPDAAAVARDAKRSGSWVAVVELTADSVDVAAMRPRYPAMLVLGNEHSGISPDVLAYADQAIAIPMLGMTNSLNVATAGAIVLHALVQRLRD